jgi:cytoskeletal protein CcmA (bactofilin family)
VAGTDDGNSVIISLAGRVPVNVSLENGPIQVGDPLTSSSTPGVAMKATGPGDIIGTALESYDGTEPTSQIMVQLHVGYDDPTMSSDTSSDTNIQGDEAISGDLNVGGNSTIGGDLNVGGDSTVGQNLTVAGATSTNTLDVTGSTTLGSLTVAGPTNLSNLSVTGSTTLATLEVAGSAQFDGDISVAGHIITTGGQPTSQVQAAAGTQPSVAISGTDTTGTITITTGSNPTAGALADILFSKSYSTAPHVVLSPSNAAAAGMRYYKGNTTTTDFMFNVIDTPLPNTIYQYDYFIAQ